MIFDRKVCVAVIFGMGLFAMGMPFQGATAQAESLTIGNVIGVPALERAPQAKPLQDGSLNSVSKTPLLERLSQIDSASSDEEPGDVFSQGLNLGAAFAAAEADRNARLAQEEATRENLTRQPESNSKDRVQLARYGVALAMMLSQARAEHSRQQGSQDVGASLALDMTLNDVMNDMAWRQNASKALYRMHAANSNLQLTSPDWVD